MDREINLYTVGFTKKSAQEFFELLSSAGIKRIVDTRLNNVSQLSGFAKKRDLAYFLKTLGNIEYFHILDFAPTQDILTEYKKNKGEWTVYEKKFLKLISERKIEQKTSSKFMDNACLLCSESTPHHCHRRLVAEYLKGKWGGIKISHL